MLIEGLGFTNFFGVGGDVTVSDSLALFCTEAVFTKLGVDSVMLDAFFIDFNQFGNIDLPACLPTIIGHIGVKVNADTVGLILSEVFGNHFECTTRVSAEADFVGNVWCDMIQNPVIVIGNVVSKDVPGRIWGTIHLLHNTTLCSFLVTSANRVFRYWRGNGRGSGGGGFGCSALRGALRSIRRYRFFYGSRHELRAIVCTRSTSRGSIGSFRSAFGNGEVAVAMIVRLGCGGSRNGVRI